MKISIFGDSILEGVRLENGKYTRGHALMSCFEAEHGVTLDNKSKFGSTIDKGLVRLRRAAEGGSLGSYTVLEFGGNDSAYRWDEVAARPEDEHVCATPPEKFREIYREMIDLVYKNGSWPIVCTLPPISSRLYLDHVVHRLYAAGKSCVEGESRRFAAAAAALDALSPLKVLARGYAVAQSGDGMILKNAADAAVGERIRVRLAQGSLQCNVVDKED